ncbi:MAG: glycosyltransferase family 4 protein [Duncaniella sp.]|nr:glycosyltransferase family 4 protein [Duncaniella sp.]
MKTGFDAKKAIVNHTGIGNYSRRVINALASAYPADQWWLYGPRKEAPESLMRLPNILYAYPPALGGKLMYELWRTRLCGRDMEREGLDIYHGLSNELPHGIPSGTRSVVTIHDLIFITRPETFSAMARAKLLRRTRRACETADRIIAISERTRRDIIEYYHIPEERISVVYQSIAPEYFEKVPAGDPSRTGIRRKLDLPERYILCVGTIETRKNHETVVRALPQLAPEVEFVIVGRRTPYADRLMEIASELGVSDRVHIRTGVDDTDLLAVYREAEAMCLLSTYEGFGLPVAEALASRVPVITATGSCLEEAGGPDTIYIDPHDHEALARELNSLMANPEARARMTERGYEYALRFTDANMARELMKVYREVLEQPARR